MLQSRSNIGKIWEDNGDDNDDDDDDYDDCDEDARVPRKISASLYVTSTVMAP